MRLALFDLDNTLLAGDSDYEWGQFLIEKGILDRSIHEQKNRVFHEAYNAGNLDIREFLSWQLGNLANHSYKQLKRWHKDFMLQKILPLINQESRKLIDTHKNDVKIMVTATNSFVTKPIAEELNIPNLIATEPQVVEGEFSGKVDGIPAFQKGKVDRLKQWLNENNSDLSDFEKSWFYSDSANDIPLLSLVTDPIAVDPDVHLENYAKSKGWKIISLRDNQ